MSQISPPIRILLVAVIGVIAVYMLFLRPKTDAATPAAAVPAAVTPVPAKDPGATTSSGTGAIVQKAVGDTQAASAQSKVAAGEAPGGLASDGTAATGVNTSPVTAAPATGDTGAPGAPVTKQALADLPKDVRHAVAKHKVLVLLFYNNRSSDDRAVRRALSHVSHYGGQVFVDAHWIKSVARYQSITRGVDVEQSPTIVVADRNLKAETLVGFVDGETIDQAVVDALRASGGSLIKDPYFRRLDTVCASARLQAKALSQPASAAALPAYLTGLQAISVDADAKAAAVKPPKRHATFGRRFNRLNAMSTALLASAATQAKAKPAQAGKLVRASQRKANALEKKFVHANGAHGLSCF
jgi:hypothetical protein